MSLYRQVIVKNPIFHGNELFCSFENLRCPRFAQLRERYKLDKVVAGEKDEFKRILLLRHWLVTHIKINNEHPTHTRGDAFGILDAALKGGGFHCAHFMVVQNAVMNAYGYVTRCLGAGPGRNKPELAGHHGINEVWSNQYQKWFLSDAKYDFHFEKKGLPLSALEIRDEVLKNKAVDIQRCSGPDRTFLDDGGNERSALTYTWVTWEIQGNRHCGWPLFHSSAIAVYEDDYFRKHTWYRRVGKGVIPHWAYEKNYFIKVRNRTWIEWTANTLQLRVHIKGTRASVEITSSTPNFQEYQIKAVGGSWRKTPEIFTVPLSRKNHEWVLRAKNLAGVCGPEHRLVIEKES